MKKILYGLVALIGLVLVLALVGPNFVDWSRYKGEIERKTKELTGRDLTIGGPISVSILPQPTLVAEDIRLDNIPGAAVADMVTLKSLRVRLELFPLLAGRIRLDNITLVRPVVELETMADGRVNWNFKSVPSANADSAARSEPEEGAKVDEGFPRLDPLIVQEGVIVYRDSRTGHIERTDAIAAQVSIQSAAGPFRAQGTAMPRGVPARFNISIGRLGAETPSGVSVSLEFEPGQARFDFNGILAAQGNREELSGKLHAEAGDLIKLTNAFLGGAASDQLPILVNRFILDGTIQGSDSNLSIADLSLTMGESKASGSVDLAFGKTTEVKARVAADRIDLDALLKPPAPPQQAAVAKPAEPPPQPAGRKGQAPKAAEPPAGFALPANLNGTLELSAATVVYNGQETKDIRVAAALQNGRLAVEKAEARLPGDTTVSVNGAVSTRKGAFTVDGSAKLATNNIRPLLSWLKLKVDEIPEGKLTTATFSGNFATSGEEIHFRDIQASLDGSRLAGGATLALRQRPAIAASLAVDRLMIDTYLPPAAKKDNAGGGAQGASVSGGTDSQAPLNAPLAALAPLQNFDANVKLRAGLLSYHGLQAQDLSFDGTLLDGVLTVRDLSAKNVAGAQAKFTGSVGGFTGAPVVKANLDVRANEAGPVLKAIGLPVPADASKLGRFVLTGAVDTDGKNVTLDLQLAAAKGKLTVKGKAVDVDTAAKYDMAFDLDHPDLGWFLGDANDKARRPFTFKAKVKGAPGQGGQDMDVDAIMSFAGGALKAKGKAVGVPAASKYDMDFNADFPDTAAFLRALSPSTKVAGKLGATKLVAKLQGDPVNVAFTGLDGNIGPANVNGEARANYSGPRAKYIVNLTTGDMPGEFFGAPAASSAASSSGRGGKLGGGATATSGTIQRADHWSREPIDLGWLLANDAEIKLQSSGIRLGKYHVSNAQVEAVLANGALELRRFTGKLFDGNLDVKGKLVGGMARTLETNFSIDQFDVQQAMRALADTSRASGRATIRGNLRGVPRTEYDLISTLDGQASIDGTVTAQVDATTRGAAAIADLLSAKLIQSLSGTVDTLLTAAAGSESGKLKGTFKVDKGVVRTNDLQLVNSRPPGVTAQVTGTVDLPAWTINGQGQVVSRASTDPMLTVAANGTLDRPNVKVGGTVVQDVTQQVIPGLINMFKNRKSAPAQ